MSWILGVPEILHELRQQTKLMLRQNELTQEQLHESDRILRVLWKISDTLSEIQGGLFPVPNQLTISIDGDPMANTGTKPVGQTFHFVAVEVDNTTTPPTPFTPAPSSLQWSQDTLASGALVVNADGSCDLTGTVAGSVVVTCIDSVSNPGSVLKNTATVTFTTAAVVPNQLDVNVT